jgi:hypothetical protein
MTKMFFDADSGVPGVRLAEKKDEGDIFALLLMLHRENGMFGLNKDKVMAGIQWATERKGGIIYCIEEGNRVVATLGMCITCDWYSDDEYLLERWNFVHPGFRQSDYARRLIEQAKWAYTWFKRQGMNLPLQIGITSFDRTEAKVRLYARHMPCIGAFFMYGEPPVLREAEKYRHSMREIEEKARQVRGQPAPQNRSVVPLVETIIRVGREHGDVRQQKR